MGWLSRLLGQEEDQIEKFERMPIFESTQGQAEEMSAPAEPVLDESGEAIPPERIGLDGGYDQSGLAKRVAAAFDMDEATAELDSVWVAQTSATVVLKGSVPSEEDLAKLVDLAGQVYGAQGVDTEQVEVG